METSSIQTPSNSTRSALGIRDFKLYWIGQTVSMLGDQLHNIAVIWLILLVTSDPLALGLVLALGGIAEAIFSLFGGAVVDHFSPRRVMLFSDLARLLLTASLAALIFTAALQIWMIFVYAFVTGSINGIFAPASSSILPRISSGEGSATREFALSGQRAADRYPAHCSLERMACQTGYSAKVSVHGKGGD